jgi:hypothetical protein
MKQFPKWLVIQRISLFFFLACGVFLLAYALGFITDVYIFYAYGNKTLSDFYGEMQKINTGLLWNAIAVIVFAVMLFLLGLNKHPAGIVTLILAVLISAAGIFFCVNACILLLQAREKYASLDLSSLNRYIERGAIKYQRSTLTYDLGLGVYSLFLFSSLFTVITVIRNAFTVRDVTISAAADKGVK